MLAELLSRTITDGGATVDWRKQVFLPPGNYWYFPRWPQHTAIVTQNQLPVALEAFVNQHASLLAQKGMYLGTWYNSANNMYYIDIICRQRNKNSALRLAEQYSQTSGRAIVSIYNPFLGETFYFK